MLWKWTKILAVTFLVLSCGKNDGIRTAGVAGPSQGPYGPTQYYPTIPYPQNPGPAYNPGYGYSGFPAGGMFQPYLPTGYSPQFYPWLPIYWYFQQYVVLQPVFVTIWNGWQSYAYVRQIPVYSFTQFWFSYLPQVISPQLYYYLGTNFYNWMNPNLVFSPYYTPQVFWQNYNGVPFRLVCTTDC